MFKSRNYEHFSISHGCILNDSMNEWMKWQIWKIRKLMDTQTCSTELWYCMKPQRAATIKYGCMYVCSVCMYVCMYVRKYVCMVQCMYYVHVYMYACMHLCMHVCCSAYICAYVHLCMYVCMYVCMLYLAQSVCSQDGHWEARHAYS